ncbi:MAG: fibronectin type III domain-containing protein [Clostridia bacterium]|nr:fibronectin type III domain-containing protein [Clostridia bacterium]
MKKVLSVLFCAVFVLALIPTLALSVSATGDLTQIEANKVNNVSWGENVDEKYLYLTVSETGFYDVSVEDLNKTGNLAFELSNMNEEYHNTYYNTAVGIYTALNMTSSKNVYLIADNMYEIKCRYGYSNETTDWVFAPLDANINVSVIKNDYEIQSFELEQNNDITIGNDIPQWFEFTSSTAGDYLLKTPQKDDFFIYIYEKTSGKYISYFSSASSIIKRINLKENTQYIAVVSDWASSAKLSRFSISKASKNVSKIGIVQKDVLVLANHSYFLDGTAILYSSKTSEFSYKITYSDNTSETLKFSELANIGLSVSLTYKGGIYSSNGKNLLEAGKQKVELQYMDGMKSTSYINVTTYLKWCENLYAYSDFENMRIKYEDEYSHSSYWKIKPDNNGVYNFYSSDWKDVKSSTTIFDKNNNIIPYNAKEKGWVLTGGEEYCMNMIYAYASDSGSDVTFWLRESKDHIHTYSNSCDKTCNVCKGTRIIFHTYSNACDKTCNVCKTTRKIYHTYSNACDKTCNVCKATRTVPSHKYTTTTTKATLAKNGKVVKKCKVCGKVASTTTIKYAKTFKLSATSYTYNGKVKTPIVTVKDSAGNKLKKNVDYTLSSSSGRKNVGTYKVTIKMKGKYSGTKTLTFKINPVKTSVSKLTAGKKSITVNISKKSTQVSGYQVQYSTSKKFTSAKTKTISSYKTTKYTLKSLSAKKTYYVRVRTYKTVSGKKYYSGWSTYKYVKTK